MKETGLMFKAPLVRSILDGTKTQTRRVVKNQPFDRSWSTKGHKIGYMSGRAANGDEVDGLIAYSESSGGEWHAKCPMGQPGDRIYVRETFVQGHDYDAVTDRLRTHDDAGNPLPMKTWFRATDEATWCDGDGWEANTPWKPAIHMPKALARIWLDITGVRLERLQDISNADCIAEGISELPYQAAERGCWWTGNVAAGAALHGRTPRNAFQLLWESTGGDWAANPWVWAIDFKRDQNHKANL